MVNGDQIEQSFSIEGLNSEVRGFFTGVSQSPQRAEMVVSVDGNDLGSFALESISTGEGSTYAIKASQASDSYTFSTNGNFDLSISYESSGINARGYLDRYSLTFSRQLRLYGNETDFRVIGNPGDVIQFEIDDAENATIWNVSEPADYFEQSFTTTGGKSIFRSQASSIEEYVIFEGSDFPSPFVFGGIANQNLRADTNYEGIIISAPEFLPEAHRLADFHRENDGLSIKIVTPKLIYNEFSAGRQDVSAIRDYAKHVFEQGMELKYLLLFGDCSYDYKYRTVNNTNFVPTYESRDSFDPIFSHSSDDYYGFFEENEGLWTETSSGDHTMEIGIGRLPVKTIEEANTLVNKIMYYATNPKTLGKWRNEITYFADDGDGNIHSRHVEDLSAIIDTAYAQYEINKLLLDAFDQISDGSSDTSPGASQSLNTQINDGTFIVNFIGHGNERLWTAERVLTTTDIGAMNNRNKLPIFVTATCEFGRYDDPFQVSGAEELLLSDKGGAIALLTTSRPVFASTNFELNKAFHENIFKRVNGQPQRLGDIMRTTKNDGLAGPVNRNFTLLGDPMLMPSFPELEILIENFELDTISALEEVLLTGRIHENGITQENFNGILSATVFDVNQKFKTKGQESSPYTYTLRSNAIFRGEAEVIDGRFTFSFIVPKNISYQFERGKISLYALDVDRNIDASGSSKSFVIGGTFEDVELDNQPPDISMFLNNQSFVNGGTVGKNSLLIANLADESGITTASSGVVSGIVLELNEELINLNEYYTASADNYQEGSIVYPIRNLESGNYTATLTVWDTHNNSRTESIEFVVSDRKELFIYNDLVYPNPARRNEGTVFRFEHDRENEDMRITMMLYDDQGRVILRDELLYENSERVIEIPWQIDQKSLPMVNEGIYYYRLVIQSNFDGAIKEIMQKIVVIN